MIRPLKKVDKNIFALRRIIIFHRYFPGIKLESLILSLIFHEDRERSVYKPENVFITLWILQQFSAWKDVSEWRGKGVAPGRYNRAYACGEMRSNPVGPEYKLSERFWQLYEDPPETTSIPNLRATVFGNIYTHIHTYTHTHTYVFLRSPI